MSLKGLEKELGALKKRVKALEKLTKDLEPEMTTEEDSN